MKIPSHWISRAESRGYNPKDMFSKKFTCERYDLCSKTASSIHHIACSYRGKKSNNEDGKQLVALCVAHHEYIHNHNNFEHREALSIHSSKLCLK